MRKITSLRDSTRKLLINRSRSLSTKYIASEIGVTPAWVNKFAAGEIENPSVVTIETLNKLLLSKQQ